MQYRARIERQKAMRYGSPKERAASIAKAEELLRQCLEKDPCDGRAYVSLGRIYVMQQRFQEAKDLYKEGTRLTGAPLKLLLVSVGQLQLMARAAGLARHSLMSQIATCREQKRIHLGGVGVPRGQAGRC
jgi:cytochrome c-type biogenesis protein CcmH/NrfG